jgi:type 2 lantibiotic biosynthesis protein LanM
VAGTALFLASLDAVRGTSEYRDLVLGAMETAALEIEKEASPPIGGAIGLGSVIYALVRIAGLTGAGGLIETARGIAARITPERIAADVELDVLSGAAGAILGLLTLYNSTRDKGILAVAEHAGRRLIACAIPTSAGPGAWRSRTPEPLAGMSHGAAGIAYALLRLSGTAADPRYLYAAGEGLAYERSLFSPEAGNWKDMRPSASGHGGHRTSWCHGAPGIGLARLGGLPYLDGPEIRRDIDAAIRTTRAHCHGPVDHLCCGVFGRIETLLVASTALGRPELRAEGLQHATDALARGLHLGHHAPAFAPGFFRGMSGIGYQLLRLAFPDSLPSVLVWD